MKTVQGALSGSEPANMPRGSAANDRRQSSQWPRSHKLCELGHVRGRLLEAQAVLFAIDAGGLLAETPSAPGAAARHQAAVSLLSILERELQAILFDLGPP